MNESRKPAAPRLTRRSLGGLLLPALLGAGAPAQAATLARPVVLELFTSQGCAACPPAEALLRRLATSERTLLPLAYHVTYWDDLGWRDPFSLAAATARQRAYARLLANHEVFTPELVVDGRRAVIGSDQLAVAQALRRAAAAMPPAVPLGIDARGAAVAVEAGAAAHLPAAMALLIGFDRARETTVRRGENRGRTLVQANVVRAVVPLGGWRGAAVGWRRPRPRGERLAVLLQAADGTMLGAAATA